MQKKSSRYPANRNFGARFTLPYLHRAASSGKTNKYLNLLVDQSEYHQPTVETLYIILTQANYHISDEALFALVYEYYRLASLPNLNDYNSQRMLTILTFAEIDITLSNVINAIDAFLSA